MTRLAGWLAGLTGWRRALAAGVLGAAATAALPPLHLLPLYVAAFTGLIWLIDSSRSPRAALIVGWWFGLGHFVTGLYWFAHALLTEPEKFGWLIPPAVLGISALLAVFPALAAGAARLAPAGAPRVFGLALAWAAAEWLRSHMPGGFPWNLVAYGWTVSEPMIQSAALFGSFGLGLVTVLAAAMPSTLARDGRGDGRGARRWLPTAAVAALVAVVWTGGAIRLSGADSGMVDGVRLRIVQPNISQPHKWKTALREELFLRHIEMSVGDGFADITHVIWSETAVPYFIDEDPQRRRLIASVTPLDGVLVTGAVRRTPPGIVPFELWNSLYAIDDSGDVVAIYDKARLVPFGEFVPLRSILPIDKITPGSIDFSAGPGPQTISLPGLPPVSPLICYEAIFPGGVVDPDNRPEWMLNITNDAWFGISSGPYQHFASARMRAVEQGLPLVRAANTGISGVVDAWGRVVALLGLGEKGILDTGLPRAIGTGTIYSEVRDWPLGGLLVAGVLILGWTRRRAAKRAEVEFSVSI
jgi:apolipoprotein N-acyltransferase